MSTIDIKICAGDLEALLVGTYNGDFQELERLTNVFCPFEAIGMVRQEIRHSHFLAYILDPNRPHRFGSTILRMLLQQIANEAGPIKLPFSTLDIHFQQLDTVRIRREWRDIDLLIEIPSAQGGLGTVIAIELKIDAAEHSEQLIKYKGIVESEYSGWERGYAFLTVTGDTPSMGSQDSWITSRFAVLPKVSPVRARFSALLLCYPKSPRSGPDFPHFDHTDGLDASGNFISAAGTLFPIAPCGLSSL